MTSINADSNPSASGRADTLNVTVRYAAAPKPFQDHAASRDESLQSLKGRILAAFGLTEGQANNDGNTIAYKIYHGRTELTDLSATLGALAGNASALELKLSQHVQQGALASSGFTR